MGIKTHEELMQDVWYLDTCCTNYMSGSMSSFSKLDESFGF